MRMVCTRVFHQYASTMKTLIITLITLGSLTSMAQPTVSGRTSVAKDTVILLPTNSITLTGTATQRNNGHPILDTTWTKVSGPAATITHSSNRMTTTVTNLVAGTYVFILTATDKQNSATASVTVRVLPGTLPIELSNFTISHDADGVKINWRTNIESNNAYFVVQKSENGLQFTDVATVFSKAVHGNSETPIDYSYEIFGVVVKADMSNFMLVMVLLGSIGLLNKLSKWKKGLLMAMVCMLLFSCSKSVQTPTATIKAKTQFRLKQVDLDGHFTYSAVREL
jgi:hypothetical protein